MLSEVKYKVCQKSKSKEKEKMAPSGGFYPRDLTTLLHYTNVRYWMGKPRSTVNN